MNEKKLGLKKISLLSEYETGDFSQEKLNEIISEKLENAFYLAHLDYKVILGKINDTQFKDIFNENNIKYLQDIRIFSKTSELFIFRRKRDLKFRFVTDDEINSNSNNSAIDTYQILWGTNSEFENNYSRVFEDRGIEIFLPFDIKEKLLPSKRIAVKTRNYIGFNNNQAEYTDSRLLGFYLINKDIIEKEFI